MEAIEMGLNAAEWGLELADTLAHRGHGLAQITMACYKDPAARDQILTQGKDVAAVAAWPVCEISAMDADADPFILPEAGFIVLRDVDMPLTTAIPVLVDYPRNQSFARPSVYGLP